jgi:putative ABC transport system permease protein
MTATVGADVAVLDEDTTVALAPAALREEVRSVWSDDRVLVWGRGALGGSGEVRLEATDFDGQTERVLGGVSLPAVEIDPPMRGGMLDVPALVVVPAALEDRLPVDIATAHLLVGGSDEPVTAAEERRLEEALGELSSEVYVDVERGWSDDLGVTRLLLVLVGAALVLVATLTATGLAVADARPDHATLSAIGAAGRTRRLMAMGSAGVIAATGALLGLLAGLAPGIAIAHPLTAESWGVGTPLVVIPWDLLAMIAVGVPLLAVLVTGLVVRSRLPMAQRIAG